MVRILPFNSHPTHSMLSTKAQTFPCKIAVDAVQVVLIRHIIKREGNNFCFTLFPATPSRIALCGISFITLSGSCFPLQHQHLIRCKNHPSRSHINLGLLIGIASQEVKNSSHFRRKETAAHSRTFVEISSQSAVSLR